MVHILSLHSLQFLKLYTHGGGGVNCENQLARMMSNWSMCGSSFLLSVGHQSERVKRQKQPQKA